VPYYGYNKNKNSNHHDTMNTTNLTKLALVTIGLTGLAIVGLTHLHTNLLPMFTVGLSYLVALGILGLAAYDQRAGKRLS
jgi:lysozyme family protein